MSKAKIQAAATATDKVFELVGNALGALDEQFEGRVINGCGVHRDPSQARLALFVAIDELNKAKAIMEATAWPTNADYDQA